MKHKDDMSSSSLSVADDMVVSMAYVLRLDDGEEIDRSEADDPLVFLQGHGEIIPGLEQALYGLAIGDGKKVVVGPEEAYGDYDDNNIVSLPHSAFPPGMDLEIGQMLYLNDGDSDEEMPAFISEIGEDEVLLDLNHPLAGETLYFEIEVVDVRKATADELNHGHVHGPGGAH